MKVKEFKYLENMAYNKSANTKIYVVFIFFKCCGLNGAVVRSFESLLAEIQGSNYRKKIYSRN